MDQAMAVVVLAQRRVELGYLPAAKRIAVVLLPRQEISRDLVGVGWEWKEPSRAARRIQPEIEELVEGVVAVESIAVLPFHFPIDAVMDHIRAGQLQHVARVPHQLSGDDVLLDARVCSTEDIAWSTRARDGWSAREQSLRARGAVGQSEMRSCCGQSAVGAVR